jgi:drug/metabolite transporter (DMT)-like permease
MQSLSRRQLALLVALTLAWGLNWPVMKLGVSAYPPLAFRAISVWLGLPLLALGLRMLGVPFHLPRRYWPALLVLAFFNMFVWHACMIIGLTHLSSGRAAILGYTMPVFSALMGAAFYGAIISGRNWLGVAAAATGVVLLLWHELHRLAGAPVGVALLLVSAVSWALGTQLMRHTRIEAHTLTLSFWMTALTAVFLSAMSLVFEVDRWQAPSAPVWGAIVFNAVVVFGFAQPAWLTLARSLPPTASSLSVSLIPVLGVFSGAYVLGEVLHWQDWASVALMVTAIASVLWPSKSARGT